MPRCSSRRRAGMRKKSMYNNKKKKEKDDRFSDKKVYGITRMFLRLIKKTFKYAPIGLTMLFIVSFLQGFGGGFTAKVQQYFYDRVEMLYNNEIGIGDALSALVLFGLFGLAIQLTNSFVNLYFSVFMDRVSGINQREINMKLSRLSPILFEDTGMLDDMEKASQGMYASVYFALIIVLIIALYIPCIIVMGWYLFSLKPLLAISIVVVFIPVMLSQILKTKVYTKVEDKSAPKRREMGYYESCCSSRNLFKETRILGAFGYFHKLYKDCLRSVQQISWKANIKTGHMDLGMNLVSLTGYLFILYITFTATMNGEISIGAFVAVINSIGSLFGLMNELICSHFNNISKDLGKVRNYIRLLEFEEHGGTQTDIGDNFDIVLDNVSFRYPAGKSKEENDAEPENPTYAVKNVSLTIKNGETIAIVGENGSGKSTLVRLLTGMYKPVEGDVYLGSHNTKNLSLKSAFAKTSGVFQKYQRYQMTLSDNISISMIDKKPDKEILDEVSIMASVDVDDRSFPQGYDTMLSREFDGVDLSGGQWQCVAIARGFYRDHRLIVLDEPTAAIDPLEERNIYDRFAKISRDKTAVIVTHRLGSVKLADRIVMMEKGAIVGCGSHNELYAECTQYAKLWDSQAESYK